MRPNSWGVSRRARMMPTIKETPWLAKLSMKLQVRPEMVFCLRDIQAAPLFCLSLLSFWPSSHVISRRVHYVIVRRAHHVISTRR